jgi:hypothetical protein
MKSILYLTGIAILLVACQPASTNLDDYLIGIWQADGSRMVCQFNQDGTYRCADKDLLEELPADLGEYQLDGTFLTFKSSDESRACPGKSGSYDLELTNENKIIFKLVDKDECSFRSPNIFVQGKPADYPWSRVSP